MPVPLVNTAPVSEFGELPEGFADPQLMDRDNSYVPGFSDLRRARDTAVAEHINHKRDKASIPTLPVNMRWARNQNMAGTPDSSKQFSHNQRGYRVASKEDIGQPWLTAMPPGASEGADGSIRKGDTVLMVCDAPQAAKNERAKQVKTAQRVTGMEGILAAQAKKDGTGWRGVDPTIERKPSTPFKAPVATVTGK